MSECLSNDDIKEICKNAFEYEYDTDTVGDLLDEIYKTHDKETKEKCINTIRTEARERKQLTRFNEQLKQFKKEYIQKQIAANVSGVAELSTVPKGYENIEGVYSCGDYILNDKGVKKTAKTKDGDFILVPICSHPLLIVERLRNIQDNCEKVVLAFCVGNRWETVQVEREVIASNTKIIRLANSSIDVTSETAKDIVKYLQCLMQKNINLIKVSHTVNRLGWQGGEFVPYSDKVKCDSITEFSGIYRAIESNGNYELWRKHCLKLRENIYLRLTMAASFAAPLIEIIGGLPFIVHLWGGTGAGKTVALNVAASVWGKPSGGLVRTLNGTSYGISETAAFMYSLPCILDELQTIKGGNTSFNQMIMTLTEGMNKTQGAASGGIRQVKQWKNCFICSGEENIVKDNSGGGSINRVISLEVQDTVIEDGNYTMNVVSNNYGFAGREFISRLKEEKDLINSYRDILKELQADTDTTDKQCMAMAFLLLADSLAVKYIFKDECNLNVNDVKQFMATKSEVDIVERAYKWLCGWVAQNKNRFDNSINNNGQIWGKIENGIAAINKNVLTECLQQNGFDYGAVMPKFAERGYIMRTSQGKYVHHLSTYGIKAYYVKAILSQNEYKDISNSDIPKEWI